MYSHFHSQDGEIDNVFFLMLISEWFNILKHISLTWQAIQVNKHKISSVSSKRQYIEFVIW